MKTALQKPTIPQSQIFVISDLEQHHFDPNWHAHAEYQLFVVLEGTGTRFIGDSITRFQPGELILTGPHLPHLWRSDDAYFDKKSQLKTRGIVVYLNDNFLGDHILDKEEMVCIRKLFTRSMRGIEFSGPKRTEVISLLREMTHMRGLESVIRLLMILNLLAGCKEYNYISHNAYENPFRDIETGRMNIVYEYVLQNFRKKVVLEDLADMVHMTPTSFSRYFTMRNNKTFSRFITEIRIKHACKLLLETEESVSEICYSSGFNTLSNFNKQFKEVMLKKPSEYKKEFMNI